eukprot:PDM72050.1 hypothetical protein PRIPAC_38457 [Pristionchus pacificus]
MSRSRNKRIVAYRRLGPPPDIPLALHERLVGAGLLADLRIMPKSQLSINSTHLLTVSPEGEERLDGQNLAEHHVVLGGGDLNGEIEDQLQPSMLVPACIPGRRNRRRIASCPCTAACVGCRPELVEVSLGVGAK